MNEWIKVYGYWSLAAFYWNCGLTANINFPCPYTCGRKPSRQVQADQSSTQLLLACRSNRSIFCLAHLSCLSRPPSSPSRLLQVSSIFSHSPCIIGESSWSTWLRCASPANVRAKVRRPAAWKRPPSRPARRTSRTRRRPSISRWWPRDTSSSTGRPTPVLGRRSAAARERASATSGHLQGRTPWWRRLASRPSRVRGRRRKRTCKTSTNVLLATSRRYDTTTDVTGQRRSQGQNGQGLFVYGQSRNEDTQ